MRQTESATPITIENGVIRIDGKAMYGKVVMEVEVKEKVKVIVRNTLEKRFADDFIFDPIVVIFDRTR